MILEKIFFSYSRADGSEFALRLAVDLKQKGFDVWIDQEDIRAGSEWDIEIEKALENTAHEEASIRKKLSGFTIGEYFSNMTIDDLVEGMF